VSTPATDQAAIPTTFAEAQEVLARALPGYTRRAHQMAMAERVEAAILGKVHGLFQAGCGTGKSFALLIPVILGGNRTIVATATKMLQSQYRGDLLFLQERLGVPFEWAILKGRGSYPCLAKAQDITSPTPGQKQVLIRLDELAAPGAVAAGEVADKEDFPRLTDPEWRDFSMSASECPGKRDCPFGDVCIAERAKAKAAQSKIVVTNTAYLIQDLLIRDVTEGDVALLGEIGQIVVDEAHTLEDVATGALEDSLSERGFDVLGRDIGGYLQREGGSEDDGIAVGHAARLLWMRLGSMHADWAAKSRASRDPMPLTTRDMTSPEGLGERIIALGQAIDAARTEVRRRRPDEGDKRAVAARYRLLNRAGHLLARLEALHDDPADMTIRWAEEEETEWKGQKRKRIVLRSAPVSVEPFLRRALWDVAPVILSSATLAPGGDFTALRESLGLAPDEVITHDAGTPFDYPRQAMLFVPPKGMPEPVRDKVPAWRGYAQATTRHLVEASGGGALLLFTSRAAMNEAWDALAPGFEEQGLTVLRQGDQPAPQLVKVMKEDGNGVLFALRTFFEGVDIQGTALRLVIVDKLPFVPPSDLVHKARCEAIERKHHDQWASWDRRIIPGMELVLMQALGRLIRHADDRGLMAVLDPRLSSKGYGDKILKAMPPARRTTDVHEAARFLRSL